MRKLRKQPVGALNPWDFSVEPGERVYERRSDGVVMYDLRESTGWGKRMSAELTPHLVKKNGATRFAVMADNGEWYWAD